MLAAKVKIEGSDQQWVVGLQWEADAQVIDTSRFGARLKSPINGVVGLTEATLSAVKGVPSLAALVSLCATDGINLFLERVTVEGEAGEVTEGYWVGLTQDKSPVYGADAIYSCEEDALTDLQAKLQALGEDITLVVGANAGEIADHNNLQAVSLIDFLNEHDAFSQLKTASSWGKASTLSVRTMITVGVLLLVVVVASMGYYLYESGEAKALAKEQIKNARIAYMRERGRITGAPDFNGAYGVLSTLFDHQDWYVGSWEVRGLRCGKSACELEYRTLKGSLSEFAQASGTPIDQLGFNSLENGTVTKQVPYQPQFEQFNPQGELGSFNQMVDFCQKARKGGVTCQLQVPTPLSFNGIEHVDAGQLFSFGQLKLEGSLGDMDFLHRELFVGSQYKWIRIAKFDLDVTGETLKVMLEGFYVVR